MNAYQNKYNAALAHYTMVNDRVSKEVAQIPDWTTDEELDAFTGRVMEIEQQWGYTAASEALKQAENELLTWAQETIKKLPEYNQDRETLEMMFTKGVKIITVRQEIIDLACRLAA